MNHRRPDAKGRKPMPAMRTALALSLVAGAFVTAGLPWLATPAEAQAPLVIRMATLVPDGSSWHQILKETADGWKRASGGRVTVRLFPGGVAGDDPDVVRKMRLGTLNAGVLTSVGVAEIDKSVYAMGIPLMYESYEEVYYVHEKMRPKLEAALAAKGFVVLNWADGGWVRFFARKPVAVPDDLRALKLFSWAGDAESVEVWRSAGFNPVPLPSTELATALQTGLVEALGSPPQVAVISQFFNHVRHMTDLRWQLLQGATLISKSAWDKVPEDARPRMLEIARDAGARLQKEIRDSEAKDVEAMKKRGLTVVPVSASQRAEWQKLTESLYPRIRGRIVPAEAFDEAMRYRDEYRRTRGAAAR
jgi:TRAP-type C4-dicarboxylate transport system substrate-binding protein